MTFEKTLDLYRQNARKSTIPHIQMEFAKYLIEIGTTLDTSNDEVSTLKARQTLVDEGIGWIKRLATQGFGFGKPAYAEAQFFLGECYGSSLLGVEVDHERAFALFVQSSKQNHPAASYYAAVYYEMGVGTRKDYPRAVQFYRKAAALGHSGAMLKLALTLLNGTLNVVRNEREAVTWLKRAANVADENHPDAIHELALVYEKDNVQSVIMDEGYARELFTKAAQLGFSPSQYKLGKSYEYGQLTCEVDARRSVSWYTRAAEQGHSDAELALSGWYLTGSEGVLEQNDTEAYLWARKAAEKGFANAEYAIGYYTEGFFNFVKYLLSCSWHRCCSRYQRSHRLVHESGSSRQ